MTLTSPWDISRAQSCEHHSNVASNLRGVKVMK